MKCHKCGLPKLHGGSAPDRKTYYEMARQSYKSPAEKNLNGWELVTESPTIKIYKSGNDAVVSIRGSYDARDARADSTIAVNSLHLSDRYKEDEKFVSDFKQQNPDLKYYGVGHSLGGAILDLFLHKGLVSEGQSYNPAVQPHDFRATLPVHRIFMSGDPLYTLVKMFLKQTPEVINENTSLFTNLARLTPIGNVATAGEYLKSHGLKQFEGKGLRPQLTGGIIDSKLKFIAYLDSTFNKILKYAPGEKRKEVFRQEFGFNFPRLSPKDKTYKWVCLKKGTVRFELRQTKSNKLTTSADWYCYPFILEDDDIFFNKSYKEIRKGFTFTRNEKSDLLV